jgi:hypothetical protein
MTMTEQHFYTQRPKEKCIGCGSPRMTWTAQRQRYGRAPDVYNLVLDLSDSVRRRRASRQMIARSAPSPSSPAPSARR